MLCYTAIPAPNNSDARANICFIYQLPSDLGGKGGGL